MRAETRLQLRNHLRSAYQNLGKSPSKLGAGGKYGAVVDESDLGSLPSDPPVQDAKCALMSSLPSDLYKHYAEDYTVPEYGAVRNWFDRVPFKTILAVLASMSCSIAFLLRSGQVHRSIDNVLDMRQFQDARDDGEYYTKARPAIEFNVAFLSIFLCMSTLWSSLVVHYKLHQEVPHIHAQKERSWSWYLTSTVTVTSGLTVTGCVIGTLLVTGYLSTAYVLYTSATVTGSIDAAVVSFDQTDKLAEAEKLDKEEAAFVKMTTDLKSKILAANEVVTSLDAVCGQRLTVGYPGSWEASQTAAGTRRLHETTTPVSSPPPPRPPPPSPPSPGHPPPPTPPPLDVWKTSVEDLEAIAKEQDLYGLNTTLTLARQAVVDGGNLETFCEEGQLDVIKQELKVAQDYVNLAFTKRFQHETAENICFGSRCLNLSPYKWVWSHFDKVCICDEDLDTLEEELENLTKALGVLAIILSVQSLSMFILVCCNAANFSFLKWRVQMEDGRLHLVPRSFVLGVIPQNAENSGNHQCFRRDDGFVAM